MPAADWPACVILAYIIFTVHLTAVVRCLPYIQKPRAKVSDCCLTLFLALRRCQYVNTSLPNPITVKLKEHYENWFQHVQNKQERLAGRGDAWHPVWKIGNRRH